VARLRIAFEKQELSPKSDFDLGGPATYYTRPMSPPWSRPLDVDRLADGGADVDFAVALAELSGLRSLKAGVAGEVRGRAHFTRQQGVAVAELTMQGAATLECQRCMQPMQLPIGTQVRVGLLASEADIERLPADLEPMLAPGGRVSIGELITEELLLTLPIVPLHAGSVPCTPPPGAAAGDERASGTHKPFARLDELLKR
jgi:uncharacterized protein